MKNNALAVALIQHPPVFLNLSESLKKAKALIEKTVSEKKVDLVVFPETWLPGYPVWLDTAPKAGLWDYPPAKALYGILRRNSLVFGKDSMKMLLDMAKKYEVHIVMGAHEEWGNTLYNTQIFIHSDGKGYDFHRKLMPTYTERLLWGQGDGSTLATMETPAGCLGGLICWEHWMPLARAAMHAKKERFHVAQWPAVKELHQIASRHYAFEGQCYVFAAGTYLTKGDVLEGFDSLGEKNQTSRDLLESIPGDANTVLQNGGSAIIAPDTSYVVPPLWDTPGILYGFCPTEPLTEGHLAMDSDGHYTRPDVFQLKVNTSKQEHVSFFSS